MNHTQKMKLQKICENITEVPQHKWEVVVEHEYIIIIGACIVPFLNVFVVMDPLDNRIIVGIHASAERSGEHEYDVIDYSVFEHINQAIRDLTELHNHVVVKLF